MMTKREEAARAIQAEYEKHYSSDCWPTLDEAESLVDAVIACIREPDEKMLEAGENTFFTTYTGTASSTPDRVWFAMIDAMT